MPVLPGPRPGLVRPPSVRRRGLPLLHEGETGLPAALLHPGGEGAGERDGRLLRPLSWGHPELPAHQRQPEVWAAGGSGPEDAALLGQCRVRQASHLCGSKWLVGCPTLTGPFLVFLNGEVVFMEHTVCLAQVRPRQHQDRRSKTHVLPQEVHLRGTKM